MPPRRKEDQTMISQKKSIREDKDPVEVLATDSASRVMADQEVAVAED
jgi:hypothetical protein